MARRTGSGARSPAPSTAGSRPGLPRRLPAGGGPRHGPRGRRLRPEIAPIAALQHRSAWFANPKGATPLAAADLAAQVADQAARGWQADDAVLRALAAAGTAADRTAVGAAVDALYRPWVQAAALSLQAIVGPTVTGPYRASVPVPAVPGVVALFVDGLRLDLGHRLATRLRGAGLDTDLTTGLAALPTVTATAKAALVPVAAGALGPGPGLQARNATGGNDGETGP